MARQPRRSHNDRNVGQLEVPRFEMRCSSIVFSAEEITRLHARGDFYQALMVGQRLPTTPAQQHFVDVCHGSAGPTTADEHVWRKYCRRVAWEADPANRSAMGAKRMAADTSWGGSRVAIGR
jgi:uncharacterized protein YifE (UPF0438 family)